MSHQPTSPSRTGWRPARASGIIHGVILGERVRLRRVERADLPRFVGWLNDPSVRDHLALFHPLGLSDEERWFEGQAALEPVLRTLSIEARAADVRDEAADPEWTHIGAIGLHHVDWKNRTGELGIVIGDKGWWGRAQRSYEKVGFKAEGRLRQDRFHGGRYLDTVVMGLLRDELVR